MDKKGIKSMEFSHEKTKSGSFISKIPKNSLFHQRSVSHDKGEYLDVDDEDPLSSYVPKTATYQQFTEGFKPIAPRYVSFKNKHRSAEGGDLEFTGQKSTDGDRPHSARHNRKSPKKLSRRSFQETETKQPTDNNVSMNLVLVLNHTTET